MKMKWIQRGIIVVLVGASLTAAVRNLISTGDLGSMSDDPVADWETRFAPLKDELPFRRGVVGYISDSNVPGAIYDPANDQGEYVLTQYVLAPIVIVTGTDKEWNVANLDRAAFDLWQRSNHVKFEVTTFKGGLYLLHRIGP